MTNEAEALRVIARKWERRAKSAQSQLETTRRSLDATIETLDKLSTHLTDLRTLITQENDQ